VIAAIDEIIATPDVDPKLSAKAAEELAEPAPEEEEVVVADLGDETGTEDGLPVDEAPEEVPVAGTGVLGHDEDFWVKVGIDPVQMITSSGTFYTLRCYMDDKPIFLGRNGRISVFSSERALARYLADIHDHDLSSLSTYEDIYTAATDGSLDVEVTEDNIYVLTGLADDLADGPDGVDRDQLELAVELLRDVGDYSEDDAIATALGEGKPLGKFVSYVLDEQGLKPAPPYTTVVDEFEKLERFVDGRLRRE
jgi:hypothetical protein